MLTKPTNRLMILLSVSEWNHQLNDSNFKSLIKWLLENLPTEQFILEQTNDKKSLKIIQNIRNDCSIGFNNQYL